MENTNKLTAQRITNTNAELPETTLVGLYTHTKRSRITETIISENVPQGQINQNHYYHTSFFPKLSGANNDPIPKSRNS
jgi:hypothetical protein